MVKARVFSANCRDWRPSTAKIQGQSAWRCQLTDGIERWLTAIGLGKYVDVFAQNEITIEVLPELAEADLKELGLPLGPRKLLLRAISELADKPAEQTCSRPTAPPRRCPPPPSAASSR